MTARITSMVPVSSSQVDAQSYRVELDAGGTRHSCVVDNEGKVGSVQ